MNTMLLVDFPESGGIAGFVYWTLKGIMSWGWVGYGVAIFMFTVFIKLILSPIDFFNRYLSRKNQIKQQALAGEIADLHRVYGNDPMAFARARQELFRKNGVGGLGSSLMVIVSLIITMVIFFQVMSAMNQIANVNIHNQYEQLSVIYQQAQDENWDAETTKTALNEKYQETSTSFMWIKNVWQPDTFWDSATMTFEKYNASQPDGRKLTEEQKTTYEAIYNQIDQKDKGNGWLLLVVLAGVTSFLASKLSTMLAKRNAPQKTANAKKPEEIITYSLRDAKYQNSQANTAAVDPAQMGKIMQFVMPAIMMMFAMLQSASFAIYMIASSVVSTLLTVAFSFLADFIIKKQKPKKDHEKDFDASIINPHAKYFKGGRK